MVEAKKYIYTIGRRKTASATVRLYQTKGDNKINEKPWQEVYNDKTFQKQLLEPFYILGLKPDDYMFTAKVMGGGVTSRLGAVRLGLARGLVKLFPEKRTELKVAGLLTRDSREKERKKPGLRKARKAEQYSKR